MKTDNVFLQELTEQLTTFAQERDWNQFHSPRNLATALVVEVGELLEHFQWRTDEEISVALESPLRSEIEEEIADVFLYLVRLAQVAEVDLLDIAYRKIEKNALRYPANVVRGSAEKQPPIKEAGHDD